MRFEREKMLWTAALLALALPAAGQTPTVTRLVPAFGSVSGTNIVIVTGTGFAAGATVTFGGFAATGVSVTNATTLTVHTPAHLAGSVTVSVTNPGGAPGSRANAYKYLAPTGTFGIQHFPVTVGAVTDIAAGSDGNLWLLNNGGEDVVTWSVSKMTTAGAFTDYPLPDAGLLTDIAPGPDGNVWYTRTQDPLTPSGAAIGRITPSGVATEFAIKSTSDPRGIAAGPDGAVWFGESYDTIVGRMTTSGSLTEYTVDTRPYGITLGPDGALWLAGRKLYGT
jgi:streptogramin lyase